MRFLLLTDIPPCSNLTAGLVLEQLCRFMPSGSIVCFTVFNPHLTARISPDLQHLPIAFARKPSELRARWARSSPLGMIGAWLVEEYHALVDTRRLLDKAEVFARHCGVNAIWAILEGQTLVRMALPLAKRLNVPLFTQVFDPLPWWMKAHGIDTWHTRSVLAQFDRTIRASEACATASRSMADAYFNRYGARCVPLIASHPATLAAPPGRALNHQGELTIAMAGQFYAAEEWNNLVRSVEAANWTVVGRKVRIQILGAHKPDYGSDLPQIDFLGWKSQQEAVEILSQADILYCPYPFSADMEEVARLSFPSKLVLYLLSGRPVLFHGPSWSSPGQYMEEVRAGVICGELNGNSVYGALERLVGDSEFYAEAAANAHAAFLRDFTLGRMQESLYHFLGTTREHLIASNRKALSVVIPPALSKPPSPPKHLISLKAVYRNPGRAFGQFLRALKLRKA
jgi:glycosyltransferase involved in cell wall biosynthesis